MSKQEPENASTRAGKEMKGYWQMRLITQLTGGFRVFIAKTNAREIPLKKKNLITCNAKARCSLGRDNHFESLALPELIYGQG